MGLIPGQGTLIPCAAEQLSPRAATTEPACTGAHRPQLETPCTSAKDPHDATKVLCPATEDQTQPDKY